MSEATEIKAIAQAIEAYLQIHPDAADSLDGITSGWLGQKSASRVTLRQAAKAVAMLLAEGRIEKAVTGSGDLIYRAARKK